jgi:hypothetical protein
VRAGERAGSLTGDGENASGPDRHGHDLVADHTTREEDHLGNADAYERQRYRRPTAPRGPTKRKSRFITLYWRGWVLAWYFRPFHGAGSVYMARAKDPNDRVVPEVKEAALNNALRPKVPVPRVDTASIGACYGEWGADLPLLTAYLCDVQYDSGVPIGQVRLSLERVGSRVRAKLQLAKGGLILTALGDSPGAALVSLEGLLTAEDTPWEVDLFPIGVRNGKKSK